MQDRCLKKETADGLGLRAEDLLGEIIHDEAMRPGESGDEISDLLPVTSLDRECCKLQSHNPALGTVFKLGNVVGREIQFHGLVEEQDAFFGSKAEILGPQFVELIPPPHPREGKGGIRPACDDHMKLGRQMLDQEPHPVMYRAVSNRMVVI